MIINSSIHDGPKTMLAPLVEQLDELDFPDRETIYNGMPSERDNPIKHLIASRGCPFSCPYCYNAGFKKIYAGKKTLRYRSPEDDAFTANKKWVEKFIPMYKKEIGLPFHVIVRLDQLDDSNVSRLKDAGLHSVRAAVESANDHLRTKVLERNITKEQMIRGCDLLHKYNIHFLLQNILGLPEGTLKEDLETLEFNKKMKPTYAWASIFQPYPGTPLGDKHKAKLEDVCGDFYNDTPLPIPDKKERIELRRRFGEIASGKSYAEANRLLYAGFIK
jgi:radical SAM superfamily enzyme YgiQ (UPF0313 family)